MENNSVPKFIFRLSRFPVYRGSVLGRFYCIIKTDLKNMTQNFVLVSAVYYIGSHNDFCAGGNEILQ